MPARPLSCLFFSLLLVTIFNTSNRIEAQDFELKADGQNHWYRGNMHTHSLWSDGDDYPEMIAQWYKEHGYQFLVFTDHNTLHNKERWIKAAKSKGGLKALETLKAAWPEGWVETRGEGEELEVRLKTFDEVYPKVAVPQEYIVIQGEEITDSFSKLPVHMCATNTKELLPPTGGDSITDVIQRNMEAAISRRERTGVKTLVHLNHPNFGYAITAEQLMKVAAENFFEVYNGHPSVHNFGDDTHASTEKMWDIINTFRLSNLDYPVMY
ncbi:MAG: PHP domain-containing protein, partial [Planctomycetaceae bacterium]|nr:PHP domain-containing protein [Planctomycetaceae bacterium]